MEEEKELREMRVGDSLVHFWQLHSLRDNIWRGIVKTKTRARSADTRIWSSTQFAYALDFVLVSTFHIRDHEKLVVTSLRARERAPPLKKEKKIIKLIRWKSDHTMNWYISNFYIPNTITKLGRSYNFFSRCPQSRKWPLRSQPRRSFLYFIHH